MHRAPGGSYGVVRVRGEGSNLEDHKGLADRGRDALTQERFLDRRQRRCEEAREGGRVPPRGGHSPQGTCRGGYVPQEMCFDNLVNGSKVPRFLVNGSDIRRGRGRDALTQERSLDCRERQGEEALGGGPGWTRLLVNG